MTSAAMRITKLLLRADGRKRKFEHPELLDARVTESREPAAVPQALRNRHHVVERRIEGAATVTLVPRTGATGVRVLYLPGGAYISPLVPPHWWILDRLVSESGAAVTVLHYPLAPEHGIGETELLLDAVLRRERGEHPAAPLVVAGDSAGGALAVVAAVRDRDRLRSGSGPESGSGSALAGLLLIAPWVDAALQNPEITPALVDRDPALAPPGLRRAAEWWADGRGLGDPSVSPIHADLGGLPRTLILQGADDVLAPDARLMGERLRASGVEVRLVDELGAFHVYVGAVWTPEAKRGIATAAAFLRDIAGAA